MYTKDQVLRLIDLAWAAGLFEGEGWITLNNRADGDRNRQVGIQMTDEDVMRRWVKIIGPTSRFKDLYGPYHPPSMKEHHKEQWGWIISKKSELTRVLQMLLPMFGERRAAKAMEMMKEVDEITN